MTPEIRSFTTAVEAVTARALVVVLVVGVADAWATVNASRHLFRGSFDEALTQLLAEEEQLAAPRPSPGACLAAYKWVAPTSVVLCLLSLGAAGLGAARDARDYTVEGLAGAGSGKPQARVDPLAVRALPEADTERLVGLARSAWLAARGVISRHSTENRRLRKLF